MPELPEAEVVVRQIRARLSGATLTDTWIGRTDIVREGFRERGWYSGSVLQAADRFGKSVALSFERQGQTRYIVAELGMTGLLLFPSARPRFPQHIHVRMTFSGAGESELRYWNPRRFGRLSLLDQQGLEAYLARRFGCDPLTVTWEEFFRIVKGRSGRLKPLLMHQQVIAGIGNIYANEILFRARLHPNTRASRLSISKIEQLFRVTRDVLQEAIACGGSSVRDFFAPDGSEGEFKHRHLVYDKEGAPCPNRCGQAIRRLQSERSSFFCPFCQSRKRIRYPFFPQSQGNP
ncbi:MAG TPA: bifunctional DNA-formamidopyrimidine glycosylase/DNA-(apurinic or apyrimidinic site) lyase [Nitrospira sp.]|nr:bifunctional DNA-formamidopyrimidine glycosylase/DNA-(apurinic or apyrimidinic site) lyase [Nitrospira sp.]